jgi:uncharacterized protein
MQVLLYLAIGLLGGISGGLFGIGGGIILVPAMVLLLGFSQHMAQGTSLMALLLPVGMFAVFNYYRAGQVHVAVGLWIALGFLLGGLLGSRFALTLDEGLLRRTFALFLVIVAAQLFFKR